MLRYPRRFFGDMVDHLRGPGWLHPVASTSVLGSQFVVLAADYRAATVLWIAWRSCSGLRSPTRSSRGSRSGAQTEPRPGISGARLLAVVATQSIAVLSGLLAAHH